MSVKRLTEAQQGSHAGFLSLRNSVLCGLTVGEERFSVCIQWGECATSCAVHIVRENRFIWEDKEGWFFFPPRTTFLDHVFVCITQVESVYHSEEGQDKVSFECNWTCDPYPGSPPGKACISTEFLLQAVWQRRTCSSESGALCTDSDLDVFISFGSVGTVYTQKMWAAVLQHADECWNFFPFLFQREHDSILLLYLFDNRLVIFFNYKTLLYMLWGCCITFS